MNTRRVLEGVGKVAFAPIHDGGWEFTPFPSCLKSVTSYLGAQFDYPYLLSATGAAFRLLWHPGKWFGGNVDIVFLDPDPIAPFKRGLAAAGWSGSILINSTRTWDIDQSFKEERNKHLAPYSSSDETLFREKIVASIDSGRPVIALGVVGPPEASIITGYDSSGEVLIGWSMFQEHLNPEHDISPEDDSELNPPIGFEENGYFRRDDWFRRTNGIIVLEESTKVDPKTIYRSTLEWVPKIILTPSVYEFASGLSAYDCYIEKLLDDSQYSEDDLETLSLRKMIHYDAMTMIAERSGASKFAADAAALFAEAQIGLEMASAAFARAAVEMEAWWKIVGPIYQDEVTVKSVHIREGPSACSWVPELTEA